MAPSHQPTGARSTVPSLRRTVTQRSVLSGHLAVEQVADTPRKPATKAVVGRSYSSSGVPELLDLARRA